MVHAIRIHQTGGPEVMKWDSVEVPAPGPGQVRLKQQGVGVNYIDVYQRSGLYKMPLPFVAGSEGSGEVVAVGPGVTDFKVGDRGAYAGAPGGYAEERVMPADRLVKLPDKIDYKTGAAMMLQGMTVRYLLRQTYKVDKNTTMLLHAAAGGIGLIASQWAKHLGATIIGTVSTPDKAALAKVRLHHVINYKTEDFVKRTRSSPTAKASTSSTMRSAGHLSRLARLPEAAGPVGQLRQRLGRHHQLRSPPAVGEGLPLRHAAHARHLRRQAGGLGRQRGRAVRRGHQGNRQDQRQPHLCIEGCRPGAPRSGGAQNHRLHRAAALIRRGPSFPQREARQRESRPGRRARVWMPAQRFAWRA
jgi:D-arabinose 1-dehydrogenase-like Zn-dependent alcohol dehydrogenase